MAWATARAGCLRRNLSSGDDRQKQCTRRHVDGLVSRQAEACSSAQTSHSRRSVAASAWPYKWPYGGPRAPVTVRVNSGTFARATPDQPQVTAAKSLPRRPSRHPDKEEVGSSSPRCDNFLYGFQGHALRARHPSAPRRIVCGDAEVTEGIEERCGDLAGCLEGERATGRLGRQPAPPFRAGSPAGGRCRWSAWSAPQAGRPVITHPPMTAHARTGWGVLRALGVLSPRLPGGRGS